MAEIEGLVRALREGDDAAKQAAARELHNRACDNADNKVLIAEAGGIPLLVELLRDGSADAKLEAATALCELAWDDDNPVLIAEAGGIPPLVELLRDGSADAKCDAAMALNYLAYNYDASRVLIADACGIPPLVDLLRDASADTKLSAAQALRSLARNNDANAVAIAAAVGLEALVQLARGGSVTVDDESLVSDAALPAKRKAALVVAALLRACVPAEARSRADVQDVIRGVIGAYL
jgi:vacuolar protein 8